MYAALLLRKYPRDREQLGDEHHQTKAEKVEDRDSNEEKRLKQDDDVLDVKKIEETIRNRLVQKLNDSLKINKFHVEENADEQLIFPMKMGYMRRKVLLRIMRVR